MIKTKGWASPFNYPYLTKQTAILFYKKTYEVIIYDDLFKFINDITKVQRQLNYNWTVFKYLG